MSVFIAYPWLAAVIAALLAIGWWARRARSAGVTAALWALYTVYEYLMYARVLCSGECNIRVDLLLIYPLLLVATVMACVAILRGRGAGGRR